MATAPVPIEQKLFYGRDTAADLCDVSTKTIDDAIRAGHLEVIRLGRRVLIPREALLRFAERRPAPAAAEPAPELKHVECIASESRGVAK